MQRINNELSLEIKDLKDTIDGYKEDSGQVKGSVEKFKKEREEYLGSIKILETENETLTKGM